VPRSERKLVDIEELEQRALTLRTIGWLLLISAGTITALWIFVGFRTGSYLWFFWTVIQGAAGMGLVVTGMAQESRASEMAGEAAEPRVTAGEVDEEKAA